MAILSPASPLHGLTGLVGNLLFRNINGKTVVSTHKTPRKKKTMSEAQQLTRTTFADASAYAKKVTRDPVKYELYKRKAKRIGVPSPYAAAVTEYMRKGRIEHVDKSKMSKRGEITIRGNRERAAFKKVEVRLTTRSGKEFARSLAVSQGNGDWKYRYRGPKLPWDTITVQVEATDVMDNISSWDEGFFMYSPL